MSFRSCTFWDFRTELANGYDQAMRSNQGPQAQYCEVRKHRRFDLQFPVSLSFPTGEVARELEGITKNVSVGGLLLNTHEELPLRSHVRLTLQVQGPRLRYPVRLLAEGEVVRVETLRTGVEYAVAVKCNAPLSQFQDQSFLRLKNVDCAEGSHR